ncbi:MAG: ankyrin repeat domain-containing protein [Deltaproteobacteria bacterium]|nr:ankyrin repeat domain-containing protein [Deltaproteobacteria bacterium]
MHYCVKANSETKLQSLIDHGTNLDLRDKSGNTALMYAVELRFIPLVSQLIMGGVNKSVKNNAGGTILEMSSKDSILRNVILSSTAIN